MAETTTHILKIVIDVVNRANAPLKAVEGNLNRMENNCELRCETGVCT